MPSRNRLLITITATLLASCTLGPDYARPQLDVPEAFHGVTDPTAAVSIADSGWWTLTGDEVLQALVREAIAANLDLQIAAARVEEARAQYGIARSFLFPSLGAQLVSDRQEPSQRSDPPQAGPGTGSYRNWSGAVEVSWELDLFGRLRRESEAALAAWLSTEQGRRATLVTLVGDVASGYVLLRELDEQLNIAEQTLAGDEQMVAYYDKRLRGGLSNRLELDSALSNRARTAVLVPQLRQQIATTEHALSLLLGRMPGPIERGKAAAAVQMSPTVPAGLPAALLERRPDVLAAEQQMVAANANVGAARAQYFPRISLTGALGGISADFADLLDDEARVSEASAGLFAPVFEAGRIRRNNEAAVARYRQAYAAWRRAALNGYREVADALVAVEELRNARTELETGIAALQDAAVLSRSRYETGLSSYLEILNADQQLLDQRLRLAATRGEEQRAFVELYRALGGGWQPEPGASHGTP